MSTLVLVVLAVLVCAPAVVIGVLRNEGRRARDRASAATVHVDTAGVRRVLADGRIEEVSWAEATEVEVLRAAFGPHKASGGVVLVGAGPDRGALVPLDRVDATGLRLHLDALPGFDRRVFDEATTASAPSRTVVWTRHLSEESAVGDDPSH